MAEHGARRSNESGRSASPGRPSCRRSWQSGRRAALSGAGGRSGGSAASGRCAGAAARAATTGAVGLAVRPRIGVGWHGSEVAALGYQRLRAASVAPSRRLGPSARPTCESGAPARDRQRRSAVPVAAALRRHRPCRLTGRQRQVGAVVGRPARRRDVSRCGTPSAAATPVGSGEPSTGVVRRPRTASAGTTGPHPAARCDRGIGSGSRDRRLAAAARPATARSGGRATRA